MIEGIKIITPEKKIALGGAVGMIANQRGTYADVKSNQFYPIQNPSRTVGIFSLGFPLVLHLENKTIPLGYMTVYSNKRFIFQRVKNEYLLLLVNALIKSLALLLLFLKFSEL